MDRLEKAGVLEPELQSPEESMRMVEYANVRQMLRDVMASDELDSRIKNSKLARENRMSKAKTAKITRAVPGE